MSEIASYEPSCLPLAGVPWQVVTDTDAPLAPSPDDSGTIPVVWYNDSKRFTVEPTGAPRLGVADTLARAQSEAERSRIVSSLLSLTGFTTFAYFALEFAHDRVQRLFLHEAFTPATWRGEYVERRHFGVDPRTFAARNCNVPMVWDLRTLRDEPHQDDIVPPDADALDDFLHTMRTDGMCNGIMYSMAVPGTRLHAFMSFTSSRSNREWMASSTIEQALLIGLSVHKFASPKLMAVANEHAAHSLTPFEYKLLAGIAEGASDKEISRRLDTTAHNVDYHLRKLRKRFGVSNRIELTYLTSKMELI